MQTQLTEIYRHHPLGKEAESILRACVHCGFCTATCPTYQLLGDELDGPRGRIYQIKQILEGATPTASTRLHLDRCLTCRSCETTCPSGVRYGRLVDIGREIVEHQTERPWTERLMRQALCRILPYPKRFQTLLAIGYLVKPLLPLKLARKLPPQQKNQHWPAKPKPRKMLAFEGCVQSVTTPATNIATAQVLQKLGIALVPVKQAGCCGAVHLHLGETQASLDFMRRNIDAWWPQLEAGAEAIVVTASGCGATIKAYGELLKNDPDYADKARKIAALTKDISEVLLTADFGKTLIDPEWRKIAFHSPCTLQHGQKLNGVVETILAKAGFELTTVADAHLCCGSAGTYSILQPQLSQPLLQNKLKNLEADEPAVIATANVGCQIHLASGTQKQVLHWIELLDMALERPLRKTA
ncbi:MAG: glycolate oxidase iron-sulfur subunit [Proteobacteria bacterium]|nr:MAG: glycolate oxidase iron-sulfur subunit [Pseudomonadota bacterium]